MIPLSYFLRNKCKRNEADQTATTWLPGTVTAVLSLSHSELFFDIARASECANCGREPVDGLLHRIRCAAARLEFNSPEGDSGFVLCCSSDSDAPTTEAKHTGTGTNLKHTHTHT